MEPFERLDNNNWKEAVEFLSKDPRHAMIMLYDIVTVGMDPGDTCIHGHYFGRRGDSGLAAIAALYGLGSLFIWAEDCACLEGIGEYLAEEELKPNIIAGEASQVEYVLKNISREIFPLDRVFELYLMGAEEIREMPLSELVELADMGMLEELLEISRGFDTEQFGNSPTSEEDNRFLLTGHIEGDSSFVIRVGGRVVSKADGLWVDGLGGQIIRVFTAPGMRSKGYATACVGELSSRILSSGPGVYLEVMQDNLPAIRVYEKAGFERLADRKFAVAGSEE
ncbi:MAG: GNAT family N-acetyltransferase [Actinobacteria bacterium]|nr:GNAT family N-acetyltransferase [Actinomycetota bacterium]